jgi:hypothetical protein
VDAVHGRGGSNVGKNHISSRILTATHGWLRYATIETRRQSRTSPIWWHYSPYRATKV